MSRFPNTALDVNQVLEPGMSPSDQLPPRTFFWACDVGCLALPRRQCLSTERWITGASLLCSFILEESIDIDRSAHRHCACGHDRRELVVDLGASACLEPPSGHDVYPPAVSDIWGHLGCGLSIGYVSRFR